MKFLKAALLGAILVSNVAMADTLGAGTDTGGSSIAQSMLNNWKQNGMASYLMWLTGPSSKSLSGNVEGKGTSIKMDHYFGLGYRFAPNWSVNATQVMKQKMDEDPASKMVDFADPYVTVSNSKIWTNERYGANLSGFVRYYIPVSRTTHDAVNKVTPTEAGNGSLRVSVTPSKTYLDGALTFAMPSYVQFRFNKNNDFERIQANDSPVRRNYTLLFNPNVTYSFSPKWEGTLEYATGYLHHTTDGKFSKLNNAEDGQWISAGVNHYVTKKLMLNPYLSWGPVFRGFKNTDIGLIADYKFM